MMKISTKGRYALRIMLDLAKNGHDTPVSLRDVAERQQITLKYMESIMSILLREGLVTSTRGKSGGYLLARAPETYNIYAILTAAEGDLAPVKCLEGSVNDCPLRLNCITLPLWEGLDAVIKNYLQQYTLNDLLQSGRNGLQACTGL